MTLPRTLLLFAYCTAFLLPGLRARTQTMAYNFRHLTPNEGLSNDAVRGIAQDQYGFIWIGTHYGLNRYDGAHVKTYYHKPGDSTSLAGNFIRSLFSDSRGNIWAGGDPGFSRYDYRRDRFVQYSGADCNIQAMAEDPDGVIWLATSKGLKFVDTTRKQLSSAIAANNAVLNTLLQGSIRSLHCGGDGKLYLATGKGVLILDQLSMTGRLISKTGKGNSLIGSNDVQELVTDDENRLWVATDYNYSRLFCISPDRQSSKEYKNFQQQGKQVPNSIRNLFVDSKGRLWVGSVWLGISLFREQSDDFVHFVHDPLLPNSISTQHCIEIFQDKSGVIWLGTEGNGLDYFHPDQGLFSWLQRNPYLQLTLPSNWGRAALEDRQGNLWLATGGGLSVVNSRHEFIKNFTNGANKKELNSNSVRSLLEDSQGNIWIGTADGVNRYHPATGKMDFYGMEHGIPNAFTWFVRQLKNGKILVGTNAGLYEYLPEKDRFYAYSTHPVLNSYHFGLHSFAEDARGRWWIGTFSHGVVIYDPVQNKVIKHLQEDSTGILSNNFIQSFCEDRQGNMWIGTRGKLVCYNLEQDTSVIYGRKQGLPNEWICGLVFDSTNRLWIGTGNGLCIMNPERKIVRVFEKADGLITTQFNEQDAAVTSKGMVIFPGHKGFLFFRPEQYNWHEEQPDVYLTAFKVLNENFATSVNLEELDYVHLEHDQNFFSVEMAGLLFLNPQQCWYAYKLEGFDKDWIYTRDKLINYTNVPGGKYVFHYMVSANPADWNVQEKTFLVEIDTIYHKTTWFRLTVILLAVCLLFFIYRYRTRQREKMLVLQNKAQALEKEKALVMYENLKQHLNPHFLFNSLTSLSSLIRIDQQMAGNFLDKMSKIYRYILKNRESEAVALGEELKFVDLYIQLQKTRFEEGLQVKLQIDDEYHHRKIAPVTLQNLVENAIKHNLVDVEKPLVIELFIEDDYLVVRNNLQKKQFVETSNRQGLANMKSLYRYLSDRPMIIREDARFFTVKIPLI